MSMVTEQWAFLQDLAKLIAFAEGQGFILTGGELWRTQEQQEIHLAKGRSKTKDSKHLIRCAVDLNVIKGGALATHPDDYRLLGEFWKGLNKKNRWGGDWLSPVDPFHFERSA